MGSRRIETKVKQEYCDQSGFFNLTFLQIANFLSSQTDCRGWLGAESYLAVRSMLFLLHVVQNTHADRQTDGQTDNIIK